MSQFLISSLGSKGASVASRCIITPAADADLDQIYEHTWNHFGEAQATKYMTDLDYVLSLIAENPKLGRLRTDLNPPVRVHPHGAHVLIYYLNPADAPVLLRVRSTLEAWQNVEYPYDPVPTDQP
jgi:toxin ParE1/3/4